MDYEHLKDELAMTRMDVEAFREAARIWQKKATDRIKRVEELEFELKTMHQKYDALVARITVLQRTDTIDRHTVKDNPWQIEHINFEGVTNLFKMIRDSDDYILTERVENEDGSITITHKMKVLKLKSNV